MYNTNSWTCVYCTQPLIVQLGLWLLVSSVPRIYMRVPDSCSISSPWFYLTSFPGSILRWLIFKAEHYTRVHHHPTTHSQKHGGKFQFLNCQFETPVVKKCTRVYGNLTLDIFTNYNIIHHSNRKYINYICNSFPVNLIFKV